MSKSRPDPYTVVTCYFCAPSPKRKPCHLCLCYVLLGGEGMWGGCKKRHGQHGRDIKPSGSTRTCSLSMRRSLSIADVEKCDNQTQRACVGAPRNHWAGQGRPNRGRNTSPDLVPVGKGRQTMRANASQGLVNKHRRSADTHKIKGRPNQSDGRDAPHDDTGTRNRDIPARRWRYKRHPWRANRRRGQTPSRYVPHA